MNKIAILMIILVTTIVSISAVNYVSDDDTNYVKMSYTHSFTKALCNENNLCQDYEITCNEKNIISRSPITGAVVQFPKNWQDPRSEEVKKTFC